MSAYIRGIGQYDFLPEFEPGVAIYFDDVLHPVRAEHAGAVWLAGRDAYTRIATEQRGDDAVPEEPRPAKDGYKRCRWEACRHLLGSASLLAERRSSRRCSVASDSRDGAEPSPGSIVGPMAGSCCSTDG